jgi:tripeptide aminopeptidase
MRLSPEIETLQGEVRDLRERLIQLREILLANVIMCGEIPSPAFHEQTLINFLRDRFTESSLQNISTDEAQNVTGILPGSEGKRNILVSAHVDKIWDKSIDHSVTVVEDRLTGPGVADNSLGVATVASLPLILDRLGIKLKSNLILLGSTRSMGRGDLGGLRFFVENTKVPIHTAVCVEGIQLGRLSYSSLGMIRLEIRLFTPERMDWADADTTGAIVELHGVIDRILRIRTPQQPETSIILGSIIAGNAFNTPPTQATLRLEVRSLQPGMVAEILEQIEEIVAEINAENRARAEIRVIARRRPGGIDFTHPLVRAARAIMGGLDIKAKVAPSTGELSALADKGIPCLTLGVTKGEKKHEIDETILVEPIFKGIAQIIGVIQAIDGGHCDE